MNIKMPQLVDVACISCGAEDKAYWSEFGAEQPCLNCDAPNSYLITINKGAN